MLMLISKVEFELIVLFHFMLQLNKIKGWVFFHHFLFEFFVKFGTVNSQGIGNIMFQFEHQAPPSLQVATPT